jgi:hypothetical protein
MGTNFADGNGNVTGYLSYRHADPVVASQRDFGACQLYPVTDKAHDVIGLTCDGSSNSNWFEPTKGANAGTAYSVYGNSFVPNGSVATTPPAVYNSQQYIFMTREDDRYNAAFMAHDDINQYFKPYAEFFFMDDKTHQQVAPAALFKDSNPLDTTGAGDYYINCSNPLLSAQQAGILCTPAQIAADKANPGSTTVQVRIGRRNIEGGDRYIDFEHTNYRAVFGAKGVFANAWSYDVYGQYFYTAFSDSNQKYLSYEGITNALLVTGTAANPKCISGAVGCVPYDIFRDGGVTQAALNYLYQLGTAQGASQLRTLHADVTGKLADYGIQSPLAGEGVGVNVGFEHRNDHEMLQPDSAEESGLLSGFGSAVAPIDAGISVKEEFLEVRAPLIQDKAGAKELLFDTGYRRSDYSHQRLSHPRLVRSCDSRTERRRGVHAAGRRPGRRRQRPVRSAHQLFNRPVRTHGCHGGAVQQCVDTARHGRSAVARDQRQFRVEARTGRHLHLGCEFRAEPDSTSHRQHRLLPHSSKRRDRRDSVSRGDLRLRQYREPRVLQPDRALTEHRQPDRQQRRVRRLRDSEKLQSWYRGGERHRRADKLPPRPAAGVRRSVVRTQRRISLAQRNPAAARRPYL